MIRYLNIEKEGGLRIVVAELALDQWGLIVRCLLGFSFNFLVLFIFVFWAKYLCFSFSFSFLLVFVRPGINQEI